MSDEYTLTTEQVRHGFSYASAIRGGFHGRVLFDRWLAAHDREPAAQIEAALAILTRLVEQANSQKFQGNVEVDKDGFIASYRMPCGPVHAAIPFIAQFGIVVDEFGGVHRDTHSPETSWIGDEDK